MKYNVSFDIEFKRNEYPGKLIALEGLDGSGKTTQASLVVQRLIDSGHKAVDTKEPTNGIIGRLIKKILYGEEKINPKAMQYLFVADRIDHWLEIEKYLKEGIYVVADRYLWSSVAYGISDVEKIDDYFLTAYSILSHYHRFVIPDFTFYLDIDPKIGYERFRFSGKKQEMYKSLEKMEKIKKGYDFLLKRFPEEFTIIDANQSIEKVTEEIMKKVA